MNGYGNSDCILQRYDGDLPAVPDSLYMFLLQRSSRHIERGKSAAGLAKKATNWNITKLWEKLAPTAKQAGHIEEGIISSHA